MDERVDLTWRFEKDRFILCEGIDDKNFLDCLIKQRQLPDFQIMDSNQASGKAGGKTGFWPALKAFDVQAAFKNLKGIAIVTDNDTVNTCLEMERE